MLNQVRDTKSAKDNDTKPDQRGTESAQACGMLDQSPSAATTPSLSSVALFTSYFQWWYHRLDSLVWPSSLSTNIIINMLTY